MAQNHATVSLKTPKIQPTFQPFHKKNYEQMNKLEMLDFSRATQLFLEENFGSCRRPSWHITFPGPTPEEAAREVGRLLRVMSCEGVSPCFFFEG